MITLKKFYEIVMKVAAYNKFEQQWASPSHTYVTNRKLYNIADWFDLKSYMLPLTLLSNLPFAGTSEMKKMLELGHKQAGFIQMGYG